MLHMKHGVEAKNYEDLAKADQLKPLEVELRRFVYPNPHQGFILKILDNFLAVTTVTFSLEDLSDSIVQDFAYMREREKEMRNTNGNN